MNCLFADWTDFEILLKCYTGLQHKASCLSSVWSNVECSKSVADSIFHPIRPANQQFKLHYTSWMHCCKQKERPIHVLMSSAMTLSIIKSVEYKFLHVPGRRCGMPWRHCSANRNNFPWIRVFLPLLIFSASNRKQRNRSHLTAPDRIRPASDSHPTCIQLCVFENQVKVLVCRLILFFCVVFVTSMHMVLIYCNWC